MMNIIDGSIKNKHILFIGTSIYPKGLRCASGPLSSALCSQKRKAQGRTFLPVPLSEALELPFTGERTTQKPHAEDIDKPMTYANTHTIGYVHKFQGIYSCLILASMKFSRFQKAKKERRVNASQNVCCSLNYYKRAPETVSDAKLQLLFQLCKYKF